MQHVGQDIAEARKAAGLTQPQLAVLADVDQGYLSRVEAGERNPSTRWLRDVDRALTAALAERGAVA